MGHDVRGIYWPCEAGRFLGDIREVAYRANKIRKACRQLIQHFLPAAYACIYGWLTG